MFNNLLDQELIRRGYRTIQQKADACGLEYEFMRQILRGKHLSDNAIIEIGHKLGLTEEKIAEIEISPVCVTRDNLSFSAGNGAVNGRLSPLRGKFPLPNSRAAVAANLFAVDKP